MKLYLLIMLQMEIFSLFTVTSTLFATMSPALQELNSESTFSMTSTWERNFFYLDISATKQGNTWATWLESEEEVYIQSTTFNRLGQLLIVGTFKTNLSIEGTAMLHTMQRAVFMLTFDGKGQLLRREWHTEAQTIIKREKNAARTGSQQIVEPPSSHPLPSDDTGGQIVEPPSSHPLPSDDTGGQIVEPPSSHPLPSDDTGGS